MRRDRSQPGLKVPAVSPEPRNQGRLASLVGEVAACLDSVPDATSEASLPAMVERCNAALEASLETQRAERGSDDPSALRDELRGLARLLVVADHADAPLVMRQIRRVLGRLDALRVG